MRNAVPTVSSVLASLGLLLLAGCASVGPPTVTRDRFDYVATISDSWKRQTLLNLLKVRYTDAPVWVRGFGLGLEGRVPGRVRIREKRVQERCPLIGPAAPALPEIEQKVCRFLFFL